MERRGPASARGSLSHPNAAKEQLRRNFLAPELSQLVSPAEAGSQSSNYASRAYRGALLCHRFAPALISPSSYNIDSCGTSTCRAKRKPNGVQAVTAALIERSIKPQDSRTRNCGCRVTVFARVRLLSTSSSRSRTAVAPNSYFGNSMVVSRGRKHPSQG